MENKVSLSRRGFLRGQFKAGPPPLRPPWARPEADFLAACTRCEACKTACPQDIVVIANGYPQVNFSLGACTFCGDCLNACEPKALIKRDDSPPWSYLAAVAATCIATKGVECRICGEHCDESAIRFSPRIDGPPVPEIQNATCTGCGACVAPCPTAAISLR